MNNASAFLIFGTQRTGTTLVRTCLSSHPDTECVGESFKLGRNPYKEENSYWRFTRESLWSRIESSIAPRRSTQRYLAAFYGTRNVSAVGFKLMLSHVQARPYLWPQIMSYAPRIVYVRRLNALKVLVSREAAAQSGIYHVVEKRKAKTVLLDTDRLQDDLARIERETELCRELLRNASDVLEIVFEDYVADIPAGNARLLDFLGLRRETLHSSLKKVNPDNLRKVIANYDQVAQALEGSRFEIHLDDAH